MKETAVYALTPQGSRLGRMLAQNFDGDLFCPRDLVETYGSTPFERLLDAVAENFRLYRRHVFIAATGIAVRAIAPHLRSKTIDPAVVVLDQRGKYVISLLSGHMGGANRLAAEVAAFTKGIPVITTATDTEGLVSIDLLAQEKGFTLANPEAVKPVNMALLKGEPFQIFDPEDALGLRERKDASFSFLEKEHAWNFKETGVWVTWKTLAHDGMRLVIHPPVLIAGVGCNRGAESEEILDLMSRVFREHALALASIQCLVTIEDKREEEGLLKAAYQLGVPVVFVESSKLRNVAAPHPSATVMRHMGVSSVCEAAALFKSGAKRLLIPKIKSRNVTLAVAIQS